MNSQIHIDAQQLSSKSIRVHLGIAQETIALMGYTSKCPLHDFVERLGTSCVDLLTPSMLTPMTATWPRQHEDQPVLSLAYIDSSWCAIRFRDAYTLSLAMGEEGDEKL
jgi:hypothetical protein